MWYEFSNDSHVWVNMVVADGLVPECQAICSYMLIYGGQYEHDSYMGFFYVIPDSKVHGANMPPPLPLDPVAPRWTPCWPHEPCYLGWYGNTALPVVVDMKLIGPSLKLIFKWTRLHRWPYWTTDNDTHFMNATATHVIECQQLLAFIWWPLATTCHNAMMPVRESSVVPGCLAGPWDFQWTHCSDVIMDTMASQITSLTIVYLTFYSGANQRKHQSSASLVSPHKWPVTRKMFPFDDVIMRHHDC